MDWPADLLQAVVDVMAGRDPAALAAGLEELRSFATVTRE